MYHSLQTQDVVKELETDVNQGLSEDEAKRRLEKYGENLLVKEKKVRFLEIAWEEIREPMILLLLAVGVLYSFFGNLQDALTIFAIITTMVLVEVYNDYRADTSIAALAKLAPPSVIVIRGGRPQEVLTSELVPGDLMLLKVGERVPADARLAEAFGLQIDESSLTGESFPVAKEAGAVLPEEAEVADRKNMVFAGTVVTKGQGRSIIIATGATTELGRVGKLAEEVEEPETPLQQAMSQLSKWLALVALFFSALIPVLGYLRGLQWQLMLLTGLSMAFVVIPEELPIIIEMVLGLGAYALSKKHAVVKRLRAAETLGSVTVIATDKTGTITQNRMKVGGFYFEDKISELSESDEPPRKLLETALLAAGVVTAVVDEKTLVGNPMDVAILETVQKSGIDMHELQATYTLMDELSFDTTRKMASYIYESDNSVYVFSSGAPEVIFERSAKIWTEKGERSLGKADRERQEGIMSDMARKGWRLLGFGYRRRTKKQWSSTKDAESNLVFIGVIGFIDPPRPEVRDAIRSCQEAGIRVVMVTGDHPETAKAIATDVGISNAEKVLSGAEVSKMSDDELKEALKTTSIFARTTPEHKLRIVRLLRGAGNIVAVTGDGINDAPALKEAEIGIAMGIRGTDIAKETADMVLADDNFATVVTAVREGRKMHDNLRKGVRYYLACKAAVVSIFLLPIALNIPLPFAPIQLIVLELFMDIAASVTFTAEPEEGNVMFRPPRDPKERFMRTMQGSIFLGALSLFLAVSAVYLLHWYGVYSLPQEKAQTAAFATWMLGHIFLALNLRSEKDPLYKSGFFSNKFMLAWGAIVVAVLLFGVSIAPLQESLKLTSIPLISWAIVLGVSFVATFWIDAKKLVQNALSKK